MASSSSSNPSSSSSTCQSAESGELTEEADDQWSSSSSVSILDKLRAPTLSELNRPRKIQRNPPPVGKKRSRGCNKSSDPSVPPSKRVSEYPDEMLSVSGGKLFCKACREVLSVKKSTLDDHVKSAKHLGSKTKMHVKEAKERDIADAFRAHNDSMHQKGETLPDEVNVYRVRVVQTFMRAGVPLNKLNIFRSLLEENGFRLCDTRHLLDLVPFILSEERKRVKAEIDGKSLAVTFDGTTRLGEVMAIVVRFISDWKIQQRLIRLRFLMKSMTGEEVARELISALSTELGVQSDFVKAVMRDRASVNNVATRTLQVVYLHFVDIGCFSHTLNSVGEKMKTPLLSSFVSLWIALFSHSPKAKAIWKQQTGRSMKSFSKTRWWSKWEIFHQLMVQFGDIRKFLDDNQDIGPSLRPKLLQILNDPQSCFVLKVELAVACDFGERFVKATYELEGDGPLALKCFEVISVLKASIHTDYYPNVQAIVASTVASSSTAAEQWVLYAKSCVVPCITYFLERFGDETKPPLAIFKAARLFSPFFVRDVQPTAVTLDDLDSIPFITKESLSDLKEELPVYLAKTATLPSNNDQFDTLNWWSQHQNDLPKWSGVAELVFLIQPSSSASERVFSILNNSFSSQQQQSLQDYVETSVMLQYND